MSPTSSPERIVLRGLEGNPPPELNAMQLFLEPYLPQIEGFWWSVWALTALLVLLRYGFGVDPLALLRKRAKDD